MSRFGSRLEPLLLISVGAATVWVASGDRYAALMNPAFRWLTIVGGVVVLAMGGVALLRPRRPSPTAALAFLALWGLVLLGAPFSESTADTLMTVPRLPDVPILEDPDFPLMELREAKAVIDAGEGPIDGLAFSALGMARRLPAPSDDLALVRSYMVCCAADALAQGFRLSGEALNDVEEGEWIVVSGHLVELSEPAPVPLFRSGTASFTRISASHVLRASRVVRHSNTLPTVAEQLASDSVSRFSAAVEAAGLMEMLEGNGPFTVFAPIDAALTEATLDEVDDALREWLSWHVVEGGYSLSDLRGQSSLRTIHGRELRVELSNGKVLVGGSRLLFKDVRARNGIVHLIYPSLKGGP